MEKKCPHCGSVNTYYSKKKQKWVCEDCEKNFTDVIETTCIKQDLTSSDFWCKEMWNIAPVALSLSYRQLYDYVQEENIGCTLFLIRDVFELMIKIPVTILFNAVHGLYDISTDFQQSLAKSPKLSKLYEYSMQMLSTGKWWECVRIASNLHDDFSNYHLSSDEVNLYSDTIEYLRMLHKSLYYNSGNGKTNMVTWRNRTLGHSCLADNPEERYSEIPYILEMFKSVGDISIEYYKRVSLTDSNKKPLCGIAQNQTGTEVYIQYTPIDGGQATYTEIHNFIAGRDNNLSCFDGLEKGKAYLLNYSNGERYRDQHLSKWLTSRQKTLEEASARASLSNENVFADNLETKDISNLEEQLSANDDVIGVRFLGRWLMDSVNSFEKGMLLLTAERGLGKSTFCSTIDPFESLEIKYDDEAFAEELKEFLGDVAVRVWHFNSEYRSRKDIFIPGLRDALLTLDTESKNKICGRLESQYNNLISCAEDLRSLYFAECLNNTIGEYRVRTDKQKLLLIFDGIDEVSNIDEICSFMPNTVHLDENVYILLTCRTKQEIKENNKVANYIETAHFESHLNYTRDNVTITKNSDVETCNKNLEYQDIITHYVEAILIEQGRMVTSERVAELATAFEHRFSSLSAYRKLCRLSSVFNEKFGTDLFGAFMHQVENNAPASYVKRLKVILNTLAHAGEPITLRELAFLSGERYVSYRLLGMMNDIQAFIKVTRSSRGNCYELSHSQWEDAVKALIPYGDIYFRRKCNELLAEMEFFFNEDNIELIIEKTYEGELWLLKHILVIYNRSWKELKENWFEEIRIGSFEYLIQLFLKSGKIFLNYLIFTDVYELFCLGNNYTEALKCFNYKSTALVSTEGIVLGNSVLSSINHVYSRFLVDLDNYANRVKSFEIQSDLEHLEATNLDKEGLRQFKLEQALYGYEGLLTIIEKDDIESYAICLYKIGRENHLLKKYKPAKEALLKFVEFATSNNISYNVREHLCRAYIRLGQIISDESSDNERAFSYYRNAYDLSQSLVRECESVNYLDVLSYSEIVLSKHFEDIGCIDKAIKFREMAVTTTNRLFQLSPNEKYEKDRYYSLCKLGELYLQIKNYSDSKIAFEEALLLEREDFNNCNEKILKSLVMIYGVLGDDCTCECYRAKLSEIEEQRNKYADAYQEVLEVLKHVPDVDVNKIPSSKLKMYKRLHNPQHGFKIDPSKPFDEQSLMEQTKAILANIFRDYWAYETQTEKIKEHEERELMVYSVNLAEEMFEKIDNLSLSKASNAIDTYPSFSQACCELFWFFENIPQNITQLIPVEILMQIKKQRDCFYSFKFNLNGGNNYLESTILICRDVLNKYVPNLRLLLNDFKNKIPEEFDLNKIFENEE